MAAKLIVTSIAALSLACAVGCGGPQKPAEVPGEETTENIEEHGDDVDEADEAGDDAEGAEAVDAKTDDDAAPAKSSAGAGEEEELAQ
jgi:hypothetical protein